MASGLPEIKFIEFEEASIVGWSSLQMFVYGGDLIVGAANCLLDVRNPLENGQV